MEQHTLGHIDCPACDAEKRSIMYGESFAARKFSEAAQLWLNERRNISPRSRADYAIYIAQLDKFFGHMSLREIHIGHVSTYQQMRQKEIRKSKRHKSCLGAETEQPWDGASAINHETSCLGQILRKGGLWEGIKKYYEPLPLPKESIAIALSVDEEKHLFAIARTKTKWMLAYCCWMISRNTTAGPGEIRHLRIGDIELDTAQGSFLHITEGVKNQFRKRPVPLNADARHAVEWLLDRAAKLGATQPHLRGAPADPMRPMGSWKTAHWAIRKEAAKKFPRLARLRIYDFRHTAATDLLEDPSISFTTI